MIDAGYDIEAEIEKFLWMDAVIWQMLGWWMSRTLDSEKIHRRSINRWTRQALPQ